VTELTNHPNRKRHGHLPGHIRDAFLAAVEAFEEWEPHSPPPRVPYQVRYRDRTISIAEACGLVWQCTDILPGDVVRQLDDCGLELNGKTTYAAAARELKAWIGAHGAIDVATDRSLKRLYDKRDRRIDDLEHAIAMERHGKPMNLLSQIERMGVTSDARQILDSWEERSLDDTRVPASSIDQIALDVYEQAEHIAAGF
jgi:hypothetical protein